MLKSSCSNVTKLTIVTKIVDVFNIFVQAANLGLWIYIVLQATKAAQVWPVKLLKQRAFASVDILQRKWVRSISQSANFLLFNFLQIFINFWNNFVFFFAYFVTKSDVDETDKTDN